MGAMHVSRKADYAVRALAYLAQREGDRVLIAEVAQKMAVPKAFLSKIMKELVAGGLILSQVGPGGGYELAAPADQITFRQILQVVEGPWNLVPCQGDDDRHDSCLLLEQCSQVGVWDQIRLRMLDVLAEYTLEQVKSQGLGLPPEDPIIVGVG